MPLRDGKWYVESGDCLWNIAQSVYNNPYKWTDIADANGISQRTHIIYPNQILILPGITTGSESTPPTPAPAPPVTQKVRIDWFSLTAGSERNMECMWTWGGEQRFWIKWEYYDVNGKKWVKSETQNYATTTGEIPQAQCDFGDEAKKCRVSIRPVKNEQDEQGHQKFQDNTDWEVREYDFANNPPGLPPDPTFSIDEHNKLTVSMENIPEEINAESIEIAIYQDDDIKYRTGRATINTETHYIRYETQVDPGHYYKVKCRAVRGTIYGGWTNVSSNEYSCPVAPSKFIELRPIKISEQASTQIGIYASWEAVPSAKTYLVEWTTNIEYFDSGSGTDSQETTEDQGTKLIIMPGEGHEYFFRVKSHNNKGYSTDWSAIKSVKIGTTPSAPTTWSNVSNAIIGENINLYWTHNSTDGSLETTATLEMSIIDSAHPERVPTKKTKTIHNTKPEDQQGVPSVYTIDTTDSEWSMLGEGFVIRWTVKTAGITGVNSDASVEREIVVYTKPELALDITNKDGDSVDEINSFPFHISVLATPPTQRPISYYIEVVSNGGYTTVDNVGNVKTINPGDKIYQKYYDPSTNAWRFLIEMTPANIDLQSGINYTVNVTVAMNSGLTAFATKDFDVIFSETGYTPNADVIIDKETLTASIHPYCAEYYEREEDIPYVDINQITTPMEITDAGNFPFKKFRIGGNTYQDTTNEIQTITNISGSMQVMVNNANRYDKNNLTNGYYDASGNLHVDGGANKLTNYFVEVSPNSIWSLSANSKFYALTINEFDANKIWIKRTQLINNTIVTAQLTSNTKYIKAGINYDNSVINWNTMLDKVNIQLEKKSNRSTYIAHEEQNVIFTFSNGQLFHKTDTLEDDGIHQRRKTLILDGTETWKVANGIFYIQPKDYKFASGITCLCTHYRAIENVNGSNFITEDNVICFYKGAGNYCLYIKDTSFANITEFKAYLAQQYADNTPVTVEYDLADNATIIIPYTQIQQTAYNQIKELRTYNRITYVNADANLNLILDLTYRQNGIVPLTPILTENCTLAVYRREYDGTFTEIARDVENSNDIYVVDPHPSLDYARYRIVATADETGAIFYTDINAIKIGEPSIVIQWADKWSRFDYDDSDETALEPAWAGSMLKIPYNIDISNSTDPDVSLIEYAGRRHPVSYYGTQVSEGASWSCEIPADDVETLYTIRRLAIWSGNCYVREPSGVGYWANVKVNYSKKHLGTTIPVSFEIKRVEGGM